MKILVVAAHPDDEVLGCGGAMARWAREGHEVSVAILGEGITSRHERREQADPAKLQALQAACRESARILGAREPFQYGLPDNRFDTVPLLEIVKIVDALIQKLSPELVVTQHGGDLNIDHVLTYRAVLTATRPMEKSPVRRVYAFEVASSTEWAFQKFAPAFHPTVFVDIGNTLDAKLRAMRAYEAETRPFPHPRSPEALTAIARRWGSVAGVQAAEAFELVREVQ